MKKEIGWQVLVTILSLIIIFVVKSYLDKKIVLEAMSIEEKTMADRAACYAVAQEKSLNNADCDSVDTTAYMLFEKYASHKPVAWKPL